MKTCFVVCLAACAAFLSGCDNRQSGRGLRLPKGSVENGQAAFIALKCTECHTVVGVPLPKPTIESALVVELGGSVPRLRTVGDLLTSIIHPTQSVSFKMKNPAAGRTVSGMPTVNDVMTVTQMIDLVRFLQPRYSEMVPPMDWSYSL
jgi:L-cysteine S-thiosulfotransferase